jgi:hypothetical protein
VPALLLAFYGLNALWFYWIFGRFRDILICCDAVNTVRASETFATDGWLSQLPYEGYRSIYVFAFTHVVRAIGFLFSPGGPVVGTERPAIYIDAPYAVGAVFLYALIGTAFVLMFRRYKDFFPAFGAVFLNPISMGALPTPLQESQMVLIVAPLLLASFLLVRNGWQKSAIVTIAVLAGAAWMVKPSFFLAVIGAWLIIGYLMIVSTPRMTSVMAAVVGLLAFLIIIAPQVNLSLNRWGTLNPYPSSTVFWDQLSWGNEMWHYETVIHSNENPPRIEGRRFNTSYPHVKPENYAYYLLNDPLLALSLAGGHIIGAFNYAHLKTYVLSPPKETFSPFNILVGFIIIVSLFNWIRKISNKTYDISDSLLDIFIFTTIAPLVVLAVETRFSIFPMIFLSLGALNWICLKLPVSVRVTEGIVASVFGLFFASACSILASTI